MNRLQLIESIKKFLNEDVGSGDLTSEAIFSDDQPGKATFIAKDTFVAAGMDLVAGEVFRICNPAIKYTGSPDGARVTNGDEIFTAHATITIRFASEKLARRRVLA